MFKKFQAAYQFGKTVAKQLKGNKSKVSPTITKVKPNVPVTKGQKLKRDLKIATQKSKASRAKLDNTLFKIDQEKKKLKEGRVYSGKELEQQKYFNDMNKNKKAKGGRIGYSKGTPRRKTNVEKIKKTFGTKKGLGMQSVIYGLDKNPNITAADPKAKFIAAANKKKKKKKA